MSAIGGIPDYLFISSYIIIERQFKLNDTGLIASDKALHIVPITINHLSYPYTESACVSITEHSHSFREEVSHA